MIYLCSILIWYSSLFINIMFHFVCFIFQSSTCPFLLPIFTITCPKYHFAGGFFINHCVRIIILIIINCFDNWPTFLSFFVHRFICPYTQFFFHTQWFFHTLNYSFVRSLFVRSFVSSHALVFCSCHRCHLIMRNKEGMSIIVLTFKRKNIVY